MKDVLGSGYHVESCASGLAALEFLRTKDRLDVLIVDNNLPDLSVLASGVRATFEDHVLSGQ